MEASRQMAILGLLLLIAVVGGAVEIAWKNQDALDASAGTLNVFGEQVTLNVVQLFLFGAAAGAVALLALFMTVGGTRRRMARSAARRREIAGRERELQAQVAEANASASERTAAREERAAERSETASHR
jgi:hypothetical protein